MTKKIVITPKASQDLDDCFAYIANENPKIALQFFDSTRLTIAQSLKSYFTPPKQFCSNRGSLDAIRHYWRLDSPTD